MPRSSSGCRTFEEPAAQLSKVLVPRGPATRPVCERPRGFQSSLAVGVVVVRLVHSSRCVGLCHCGFHFRFPDH